MAAEIEGSLPTGATDGGNPVKIGGVYTSTTPTFTTGQRGDVQLDDRGSVRTRLVVTSQTATDAFSNTSIGGATSPLNSGGCVPLGSAPYAFNGTSWDRQRGDTNGMAVQPALSANFWAYAGVTGGITNTSDVALKAAAGASVRNYISSIQFKNTAAVASEIVIKDGSTVIWRGHVSASMTFAENIPFNPPLRGTANTALNVAMLTTATATIVSAQGYTGA